MSSKKRGSKIKKSRFDIILKSRKLSKAKLAEDLGYNRSAISRAVNAEYMDNQTLDDIARHLNVSPEFLTGVYPLRKLKEEYKNGISIDDEMWDINFNDPSGYDVPTYEYWQNVKKLSAMIPGLIRKQNAAYYDFLLALGADGIQDPEDHEKIYHFDQRFIHKNAGYLIPPIRRVTTKTVLSALNQDTNYMQYLDKKLIQGGASSNLPEIYEVIEEGQPDEE